MRKTLIALLAAATLATTAAQATEFNFDIENDGEQTAYDFEILLEGTGTVTETFDGWDDIHFRVVQKSITTTGDTRLHYTDPWNETTPPPSRTAIPKGKVIHIGATQLGDVAFKGFDWTDENGDKIPGGVKVVGGHLNRANMRFDNTLSQQIIIRNVRYLISATPLPLATLNGRNAPLMGALLPAIGPSTVTLLPGQSVTFNFGSIAPAGYAVLAVWDFDAPVTLGHGIGFQQTIP
jgi:hypothetical protein